ncbi:MAG TPA: peptidylprolyl isomerase [Mycobacteriales bacterium]|nr:peptidylprolyl isomerase [Mycobacteriales bacterium]
MIRTTRLAALAGLLAVTLSACGTVRAGAAAIVGDERITTSELAAVVERGLKDPSAQQSVGADRPAFERSVLTRLIQHLVLVRAAQDKGVSVDGATVDKAFDAFAQQLGGEAALRSEALKAGIAAEDLRGAVSDAALRDALADKLTASIPVSAAVIAQAYRQSIAQFDKVRSAHILVPTEAQANDLLTKVKAAPSTFAALAAQFSADTTNKATGGDLGFQGRGALEKPFEDAVFAAPPGSFVLAKTSFGFHVIHVIERRTVPLAQATTTLRRNLLADQRAEVVEALLLKTAKALHVRVSPRFGSWQVRTRTVVAPEPCPSDAVTSPSTRPDEAGGVPTPGATPDC